MNKKIIFGLIIFFVIVASVSSASAWWIFGGGSDVTINEVNFHIPEGYEENTNAHEVGSDIEKVEYTNENNERLSIRVKDTSNIQSVKDMDWGKYSYTMVDKSINGKDGLASYAFSRQTFYTYIDNGKLVMIDCPFVSDDGTGYEDFLSDVIK